MQILAGLMNAIAIKDITSNEGASFPQTSAAPLEMFKLATAPQLARACNVSRRTVDNWIKSRRIPFLKLGSAVRFNVPDVLAALAKFTVKEISL